MDLTVSAKLDPGFDTPFIIGASSMMTLIFTITNLGPDPAYMPRLKIPFEDRKLSKNIANCKISETFLLCELTGPIEKSMSRSISIDVDISFLKGGMKELIFEDFETYSENQNDVNKQNNRGKLNTHLSQKS